MQKSQKHFLVQDIIYLMDLKILNFVWFFCSVCNLWIW
jgi:hypothetical protein